MLIDMLSASLAKSGALDDALAKLDSGQDATVGVASSARPFLVAARFAADPRATLVVTAGKKLPILLHVRWVPSWARSAFCVCPITRATVLRSMLRSSRAFMAVGWKPLSLQQGKPAVVVASARALLRRIAPAKEEMARPLALVAGSDLSENPQRGIACFEDLEHCLVSMGYENSGKLDGPGTWRARWCYRCVSRKSCVSCAS